MELGTMVIGAIVIALCSLPFIVIARNRKKKEKVLLNGLDTVAKSNHSDLGICDFGMDFAIGLSSPKNYLFFYKERKNGEIITECIPVNLIQSCMVHKVKRRVKTKQGGEEILEKLELIISLHVRKPSTFNLLFFDSEEHYQLSGELELISRWELIIKEAMEFYPN